MGRDKALLIRDGQRQLDFIAELLGGCVERVFVSTRAEQSDDEVRKHYDRIVDRYDGLGPVAGILSALYEHPAVDWLVVACDLPNVDERTLRTLLEQPDEGQPFTAYRSSYDGLPEPLCAIYHRSCADIVQRFVDDGVNCPRKILIRSETRLLDQHDGRSLDNVNTPDDLRDSRLQVTR